MPFSTARCRQPVRRNSSIDQGDPMKRCKSCATTASTVARWLAVSAALLFARRVR